MTQVKTGIQDSLAVRVDRLAADWISYQRRREAAERAECAGFCERAHSLFDDIRSGVRWRNTIWNFFGVTGRQRQEDAYSHAIAWLMNPIEAHGLRDAFLKAFFGTIRKPAPQGTLECRVAVKKGIGKFGEVDIEVTGPHWWLIVENKIDCEEDQGQTEKYAAYYKKFSELKKNLFLVFLSRLGRRSKSPDFIPMSYRDLRHVIENVIELVRPAGEAEIFVRQLIQNIYQLEK